MMHSNSNQHEPEAKAAIEYLLRAGIGDISNEQAQNLAKEIWQNAELAFGAYAFEELLQLIQGITSEIYSDGISIMKSHDAKTRSICKSLRVTHDDL